MNRPISTPSTSKRNVAAVTRSPSKLSLGMAQRLPRPIVQVGDRPDQPGAVTVDQIEEVIEIPVQVVREVGDLVPERLFRVQLHLSAGVFTSSIWPLARLIRGASATSARSCSNEEVGSASALPFPPTEVASGEATSGSTERCNASTSAGSPKLMIP